MRNSFLVGLVVCAAFLLWKHHKMGEASTNMCLYEVDMAAAFKVSDKQAFCSCLGERVKHHMSFIDALLQTQKSQKTYQIVMTKSANECAKRFK